MQLVNIQQIRNNENNPRIIKDYKFKQLVKSIKEFPEMLKLRPIVVNSEMVVLGGNMRLKACKEAGLNEVWILKADELTEEQQREFIVKDNVGFGEWDWDVLANEWDTDLLEEWGLDVWNPDLDIENELIETEDNPYTKKVEAPIYEPSEDIPLFNELYDSSRFNELINKIESSDLDKENKEFLKLAATRHIVFNYQKIADLYSHSNNNMQELMEESALVIIDFNKAIELGYVKLSEEIAEQYTEDYGEDE
jgi:hypothetical protein